MHFVKLSKNNFNKSTVKNKKNTTTVTMEQLAVALKLLSGAKIAQSNENITITISTSPPADKKDNDIREISGALWYEAYARSRVEKLKEFETFEKKAADIFQPLRSLGSSNITNRPVAPGLHNITPKTVLDAINRWIPNVDNNDGLDDVHDDKPIDQILESHRIKDEGLRDAISASKTLLGDGIQQSPNAHLAWIAACLSIEVCRVFL